MFQQFQIESKIAPDMVDGQLIKTLQHECVSGVYTYEFIIPKGKMYFSASGGTLKEVSYHFKSIFPWVRKKISQQLLEAYATDGKWKRLSRNQYGSMYRSEGGLYYATVGTGAKFLDVGSMMFHDDKFQIVS